MKKSELEQEVRILKQKLIERNNELINAFSEIKELQEKSGSFEDQSFSLRLTLEHVFHIIDSRHLLELSKTDREVLFEDGSVDIFHPLASEELVFFDNIRRILIDSL